MSPYWPADGGMQFTVFIFSNPRDLRQSLLVTTRGAKHSSAIYFISARSTRCPPRHAINSRDSRFPQGVAQAG
jgi:hypothetical protein